MIKDPVFANTSRDSRPSSIAVDLVTPTPFATATNFDELFIAFAETRLRSWMEAQDLSTPVSLADLSKAVNLYQRLRKMRPLSATPDHPEKQITTSTIPAPSPQFPISNSKLPATSPQFPMQNPRSEISNLKSAIPNSQSPSPDSRPTIPDSQPTTPNSPPTSPDSPPTTPDPRPTPPLPLRAMFPMSSTRPSPYLLDIDPDLLLHDPEKLLKEARAMFRNPRPDKKHRPQPKPIPLLRHSA